MSVIDKNREMLKSNFDLLDEIESHQRKGLPQPPLEKPWNGGELISLPVADERIMKERDIFKILKNRRSQRKYLSKPLNLQELSFILWATQGVDDIKGDNYATLRPTPSGGARHPFETYIVINNVEGLKPGLYRYLALTHQIGFISTIEASEEVVTEATLDQRFVGRAPVVLFWSCIPYRSEWRYDIAAHKTILLDAGHLCQNLYIACEALGLGTCAIAAYDQKLADQICKLDGSDEFIVYIAPVGKI